MTDQQLRHTRFVARIAACVLACIEAGRIITRLPAGIRTRRLITSGTGTLASCSITCPSLTSGTGFLARCLIACVPMAFARDIAGVITMAGPLRCITIWETGETECSSWSCGERLYIGTARNTNITVQCESIPCCIGEIIYFCRQEIQFAAVLLHPQGV